MAAGHELLDQVGVGAVLGQPRHVVVIVCFGVGAEFGLRQLAAGEIGDQRTERIGAVEDHPHGAGGIGTVAASLFLGRGFEQADAERLPRPRQAPLRARRCRRPRPRHRPSASRSSYSCRPRLRRRRRRYCMRPYQPTGRRVRHAAGRSSSDRELGVKVHVKVIPHGNGRHLLCRCCIVSTCLGQSIRRRRSRVPCEMPKVPVGR